MSIKYKENCTCELKQLIELYKNVGWLGYTDKPDKLIRAVKNSLFNIGAFDGEELIGLIRVIGDDTSIIYIQDILIKEKYQRQGIGTYLLQSVLDKYKDIRQIVLMTDKTEKTEAFYKKNGMSKACEFQGVAFVKYNFES
ncbi:GNAT family N-acetyltransferase [Clostridium subterminale]|uniref:GNAT family N-acetyltransferase n=1 Tax=Clostridium subterminale TaxID=1550 RepID=A0ABN1KFZ7_CLOSU